MKSIGFKTSVIRPVAGIDAFGRRMKAKTEGSGTAQASIVARDKKLHELDSWVSELRTIARVAFYEEPQELEKLGVIVLNGPRRSAKRAEAARATSGASGQ